ncbi:MAG: hypothetical protein WBJ62_02790 [Coriobacteriia bacterium]|jgi:HAMP domain-containing protein
MKNLSIRTRILASVVVVNLLGAVVLMIFLHQSYADSLTESAAGTAAQGLAAWEQFSPPDGFHPVAEPARAQQVLGEMKSVTGAEYALFVYEDAVDESAYVHARESIDQPSLWDDDSAYALLANTDSAVTAGMQYDAAPSDLTDEGALIGMTNGACLKVCHNGTPDDSTYWGIRSGDDKMSSAHAAFPVYAGGSEPIGIVYAIEDLSVQADQSATALTRTLLAVALTLIAAALTIGGLIDTLVLKRLARMTEHMQEISMRLAGGDFEAAFKPDGTTDEIGSFETFFADFIALVSVTLKQLANRD